MLGTHSQAQLELETSNTALDTVNYICYDSQRNLGQKLRNTHSWYSYQFFVFLFFVFFFLLGNFSSNSLKLFTGQAFNYERIAIPDRSRVFFLVLFFAFVLTHGSTLSSKSSRWRNRDEAFFRGINHAISQSKMPKEPHTLSVMVQYFVSHFLRKITLFP